MSHEVRQNLFLEDRKTFQIVRSFNSGCWWRFLMAGALCALEAFGLPALAEVPIRGMGVIGLALLVVLGLACYGAAGPAFGAFDVASVIARFTRRRRPTFV